MKIEISILLPIPWNLIGFFFGGWGGVGMLKFLKSAYADFAKLEDPSVQNTDLSNVHSYFTS
jgi:hypothetical protein